MENYTIRIEMIGGGGGFHVFYYEVYNLADKDKAHEAARSAAELEHPKLRFNDSSTYAVNGQVREQWKHVPAKQVDSAKTNVLEIGPLPEN